MATIRGGSSFFRFVSIDDAVAVYIYFDTDTFHNFAETFKNRPLTDDLRDVILFSPVTFIEVFTHQEADVEVQRKA